MKTTAKKCGLISIARVANMVNSRVLKTHAMNA
jgi:hypothetical protein